MAGTTQSSEPRAWLKGASRDRRGLILQALLVLFVAALVYWPLLGSSGFSFSEGQRVLPGWEMVRSGDWIITRLFEQPYLRKPPGMPWAVAVSSLIFGQNEFSARAPSALGMTLGPLLSFIFATRWFGRPWGLVAGLAHALTPFFLYSGRSAEIESLHNLATQAACLSVIEMLVSPARPPKVLWWMLALGVSTFAMGVLKGPSGLPCLGGSLIACCMVARSFRPLRSPWVWGGILLGVSALGLLGWEILRRVHHLTTPPVTEPTARFLWREGMALGVVVLPLSALIAALPLSLTLPFAVAPIPPGTAVPRDRYGRAATWATVASLLIYAIVGVSNNRYAMPTATLLPFRRVCGRACPG